MGYDVQFEGKTYTIEQVSDDDCLVLLGEGAVDDATAANVYMTALLKFLPQKDGFQRWFEVHYKTTDDEGFEERHSLEERATSWSEIGRILDTFEKESLIGSKVTSITLQGR